MKVFKIVTNVGSEWNGSQFAHLGVIYYKKGRATAVLENENNKCAHFAKRFSNVWVQEYDLVPVVHSSYQQVLVDREEFK